MGFSKTHNVTSAPVVRFLPTPLGALVSPREASACGSSRALCTYKNTRAPYIILRDEACSVGVVANIFRELK
jgi:hypothetical protein